MCTKVFVICIKEKKSRWELFIYITETFDIVVTKKNAHNISIQNVESREKSVKIV